jgi:hypothetical protein
VEVIHFHKFSDYLSSEISTLGVCQSIPSFEQFSNLLYRHRADKLIKKNKVPDIEDPRSKQRGTGTK